LSCSNAGRTSLSTTAEIRLTCSRPHTQPPGMRPRLPGYVPTLDDVTWARCLYMTFFLSSPLTGRSCAPPLAPPPPPRVRPGRTPRPRRRVLAARRPALSLPRHPGPRTTPSPSYGHAEPPPERTTAEKDTTFKAKITCTEFPPSTSECSVSSVEELEGTILVGLCRYSSSDECRGELTEQYMISRTLTHIIVPDTAVLSFLGLRLCRRFSMAQSPAAVPFAWHPPCAPSPPPRQHPPPPLHAQRRAHAPPRDSTDVIAKKLPAALVPL